MTIGDALRRLGPARATDSRPDGELIAAVVRAADDGAFEELLRRHGPAVYGVCRRTLGNSPDADDAFQAVFMVLMRRAATISPPSAVGNWLHGVAVRTAKKARAVAAQRAARDRTGVGRERSLEWSTLERREAAAVLDRELAALPAPCRAAFVACELNGRSRTEAARDLGWPEGTVATRLAKARALLAARLRTCGVTLGTVTVATVPAALAAETLHAVRAPAGGASAPQFLCDEVLNSMAALNWKLSALTALAAAAVGTAALVAAPRPESAAGTVAPVPKPAETWRAAKPIELDGPRVTGLAVSPNGKLLAVARADGAIEFLETATRKRYTSMRVGGDGRTLASATAIAFRPTPHPLNGDVFAVTHKDGVAVGTVNLGIFVDGAPLVAGIPTNWPVKGFDPHQVAWLEDADGKDHLIATNGIETRHRNAAGTETGYRAWDGWAGKLVRPSFLAAVPGRTAWLMAFDNGTGDRDAANFWYWDAADVAKCKKLIGHTDRPTCAAASADGNVILSGDTAGNLVAWDGKKLSRTGTGACPGGIVAVAVSPDGGTAAVLSTTVKPRKATDPGEKPDTAGYDTNFTVTLFDTAGLPATDGRKARALLSWTTEKPFSGHAYDFGAVLAFAPDGETLYAAFGVPTTAVRPSDKAIVRVWEVMRRK